MSSAKSGGSERRKIDAQPVIQLETVSPDGRLAVAQVAIQNEDVPRGILAIQLEGGTPIRICSGLCVVRWPRDGKSMFLSVIGGIGHMLGWGTYYWILAIVGLAGPRVLLPKSAAASRRALELDETMAESHATFGAVSLALDYDFAEAERHIRRALELNSVPLSVSCAYGQWYLPRA